MSDQRESGTQRYIEQMARTNLGSLIDVWHAAGEPSRAAACAQLAVAQGVWAHSSQRDRDHVPGLAAKPLYDPAEFWFAGLIEDRFPEIQAEVRGVLNTMSGQMLPNVEDERLLRAGSWEQVYLFREGRWQEDVCAHLPVTRAVLGQIPEVTTFSPGSILISRLGSGTHVVPHCGPTNAVLRLHLPISGEAGGWMRVADLAVASEEGRCFVIDDSFEHEIKHDGSEDLVVLVADMAHPGLDPAHRARLQAGRPTPEDRIVAFMRQRGIEGVWNRDGEVVFHPGEQMRQLIFRYMRAAEVTGVEVDGDQVRWLQNTAETG